VIQLKLTSKFKTVLACACTTAASAAEWFFIAAFSAAMKKEILLSALCLSRHSSNGATADASSEAGGKTVIAHLPA
jgi:hypothetical protein